MVPTPDNGLYRIWCPGEQFIGGLDKAITAKAKTEAGVQMYNEFSQPQC